jgi:hypothetical protein
MKAAIVVEAGKVPIYAEFQEPVRVNGEVQVTVRAAALSNVVKSRASGAHYSSSGLYLDPGALCEAVDIPPRCTSNVRSSSGVRFEARFPTNRFVIRTVF